VNSSETSEHLVTTQLTSPKAKQYI